LIAQRPERKLTRNSRRRCKPNYTSEISDALETVYGRYKAQIKSFSGVYSKEIKTIKVSKKQNK
jgi:hypothetical protein